MLTEYIGLPIALAGAAAAVFLAGTGSSTGVGLAGRAANGVLSEDPEKFPTMLLLVALPGTQGIYGFLIGILVIMRLGLLGGTVPAVTVQQGINIFVACLPIGVTGLTSGIHQGKVCAAGIAVAAKKPESAMKALIYGAMVETYAVLSLVISFFLLMGVKLG